MHRPPAFQNSAIILLALCAASCDGATESPTGPPPAGSVAQIQALSGMNQMAWPGWPVSTVLRVRVTDAVGNGVAGMPVTFTVTAGGGTIASAPAATDTAGVAASEVWTLGPDSGEQHVQASSGSASTSFTAFAIQPHFALKGRLAFVSAVDGNADIYTMNADGTGIERLTTDPEQELQPVWAPAGDQLAFTVGDAGSTRIHTMNADGSNVKGLTPEQSYSSDPSWSAGPDGLKLAYASQRDGSDDIVSLNTSTGVVSVLAGLPGYDGQPSWSPDGRRLAFVSDYEFYDFVLDVFTMNADGTGQVPITHSMNLGASPMRYYQHPAWSPDGNLIAFVWGEDFGSSVGVSFHVAVMAPDGSGVRNLAWAGDINRYHYFLDPGSLAWSPDARGIAFSFADCEGGTADGVPGPVCPTRSVKYVPLTGGEAVTLIPNGHSPSWR